MTQETFNPAEQFLLRQWSDARRLEMAMESTRQKYQGVWERIQERIAQEHPDLDWSRLYVKQFWSKGSAGFGRKTWPGADKEWAPGIWFDNVRLEVLSDPDEPPPEAYLWIKPLAKAGVNPEGVIAAGARALARMTPEQKSSSGLAAADGDSALSCAMPPKGELLDMLLQRDSQPFIDAIMARVAALATFTSLIDDAVQGAKGQRTKA
ncbi:MAG TPA: hypothetical protein VFY71_10285 [Planctomycetota bacterium]|nr:hypothetical protein [Planctomycetota bacterium]